jgi:hypothetical protein
MIVEPLAAGCPANLAQSRGDLELLAITKADVGKATKDKSKKDADKHQVRKSSLRAAT